MARRQTKSAEASTETKEYQAARARLLHIDDLRERIIACGYWSFDTLGVERVSVETLCGIASISRPSFYRYFDNKQKLLEHLQELESLKVRTEVRHKISHHDDIEAMLVEALYLVERATEKNPYVSGFLFSIDAAARSLRNEGSNIALQTQWWGPFIERAMANGKIAGDLTLEAVIAWLNSGMVLLMLQERDQRRPKAELMAYIRRFLIRPLMPQAAG
jgi:AcrR family transcriptional regulator